MNSGDQPAFPSIQQTPFKPGYLPSESVIQGMTYRQWLIGQIASGHAANSDMSQRQCDLDELTEWSIALSDRILARLDKERGER